MTGLRFKIWLAAAGLIFILIAMPMPEYDGDIETLYDKVAHFLMFGGFSLLTMWWLASRQRWFSWQLLLLGVASGIIYAGLGEIIQIYAPGRTVSHWDFLAGLLGSLSAGVVALIRHYACAKT